MANTFATPLMNLQLPVSGPGGETGPAWADDLNTALEALDSHDHSPGKGSPVSSAGLNINADLSFASNNAILMRSVRYSSQPSALGGSLDKSCVYVVNGDLFYNNNAGASIQLTSGSGLNAASIGGIGGDYASSTASLSYSSTTKVFTFTQSSGVTAKLSCGDLSIFENAAGTQPITLKSPSGLGAAYSLTLPPALPGSGSYLLSVDSTGAVSATTYPQTSLVPAGTCAPFAGASPPSGWVLCDGSAYSRTGFSALFSAIGTTWGAGNGTTTFNVPDMRGRSVVGAGVGSGLTARTLGATLGEENHTLTASEMPVHNHGVTDPGHTHTFNSGGAGGASPQNYPGNTITGTVSSGAGYTLANSSATTGISIQNAGSGASHNNMQPSAVLNWIIKT